MTMFEDRLWTDLESEHEKEMAAFTTATATATGARARRRLARPTVLTTGAVGAAAATGAAVLALSGGAAPAFAVTDNGNGTVTVTLSQISGMSGLNRELAADGINARAVPMAASCSAARAFANAMPSGTNPNRYTVTIDQADIPAGYTGIVAAEQTPSGQVRLAEASFPKDSVPTCVSDTSFNETTAGPGSNAAKRAAQRAAKAAVRRALARSRQ